MLDLVVTFVARLLMSYVFVDDMQRRRKEV